MKIFFIGCVQFSKISLEKLIEIGADVVGVATKSQSKFNSDHFNLGPLCESNNIPYKYVRDINAPHIIDWINGLAPDVCFVFGWSSLIKKDLLDIPSIGTIGFHPSKLPFNRGRHPIIWPLVLGLKETASSFFFIDEGVDSGPILSQKVIEINDYDDAQSLYNKVTKIALIQIQVLIDQFQQKTYQAIPQKIDEGNVWRKRNRKDGQIDFRMTTEGIYNLVRGLSSPYVGAHIYYEGEDIKIWKTEKVDFRIKNIEPGRVLEIHDNEFIVKTYDSAIRILEHDFKEIPKINSCL